MAHIRLRSGSWIADVRKKGFKSQSKSFKTKEAAEAWAAVVELAIEAQVDYAPVFLRPPQRNPYMSASEVHALPRVRRDQCVGIYFLFLDGECVYVGQSMTLHARVDQHVKRIQFDSYSWINVPEGDALTVERHYINLLRPVHNIKDKELISTASAKRTASKVHQMS